MIMINENAVSILYMVRAMQILMKIKAAAVVILLLGAVGEAATTGPATQPGPKHVVHALAPSGLAARTEARCGCRRQQQRVDGDEPAKRDAN